MPQGVIYIDPPAAIALHDSIINASGGRHGLSEEGRGQLDSILFLVREDDYYPTFVDKLAYLVFSVNKGHCFTDGNKRSCIALGLSFMTVNNYPEIQVQRFIKEMEENAVHVAANRVDKDLLYEIIKSICSGEDNFPESLKLKLLRAISQDTGTM